MAWFHWRSRPVISVVMASYNHAAFVREAAESALSQAGVGPIELVVTDDGSQDGTSQQLARLSDPRLRLQAWPHNRGACAALNDALRRSRAPYIAILNSDDRFLPGRLARQLAVLAAQPELAAVFGRPVFIDERGQALSPERAPDAAAFALPDRSSAQWLRHFFDVGNALCHPTVLIRREAYDRVGLYDERLVQVPDFDLWVRLCARYPIRVLDEPLTAFRIRDGQQNASAPRPEVVVRDAWERATVLHHYLGFSDALLRQVFPEFTAERPVAWQVIERALQLGTPFHQRFALDAWFARLGRERVDRSEWQRWVQATGQTDLHRIRPEPA